MAHPTAVILVVGLSRSLIGAHTPRIATFARDGVVRRLQPVLPAVTCSVQASMLTGHWPSQHGIVGNGWYDRDLAEIHFWKQSNHLVRGEKVWETARKRDPSVTCANLFWWFNMYSSADYSVTPRPIYKADGRKIPDCYSHPAKLRDRLQAELGTFPLFQFWGPGASIKSSQWIAQAAQRVHQWQNPTLSLVYLPHLDYALQKFGPNHPAIPESLNEVDTVTGELIDYFNARGVRVVLLSEYGIEAVSQPIHINRILRQAGLLAIRGEQGGEILDAGASAAFAVTDHQVAHVYVRDPAKIAEVARIISGINGVAQVLDRQAQGSVGLDHPRGGDLVVVAAAGRWFTYYYWLDDAAAPDFARTVEIHRKPGYDPCELLLDPALAWPRAQVARKLAKRKLGFRSLLDVIPLDATLIHGSHGRVGVPPDLQPVLLTKTGSDPVLDAEELPCTAVRDVILGQLFGNR